MHFLHPSPECVPLSFIQSFPWHLAPGCGYGTACLGWSSAAAPSYRAQQGPVWPTRLLVQHLPAPSPQHCGATHPGECSRDSAGPNQEAREIAPRAASACRPAPSPGPSCLMCAGEKQGASSRRHPLAASPSPFVLARYILGTLLCPCSHSYRPAGRRRLPSAQHFRQAATPISATHATPRNFRRCTILFLTCYRLNLFSDVATVL